MHPATYILYAENYGSRAAGRYRYGFQADWKNLGGTGSRLMAGVVISNGKQHGGNLVYEIPVGHSSTTLDYARRIGLEDGLSRDADSRQRIWFLLGKVF